ncbi:MAG: hypothetical protein KDD44_00685 [Bdellovibrionales bacterium]|nr:hypothetical protein [Bdellovibrionales bacterium]
MMIAIDTQTLRQLLDAEDLLHFPPRAKPVGRGELSSVHAVGHIAKQIVDRVNRLREMKLAGIGLLFKDDLAAVLTSLKDGYIARRTPVFDTRDVEFILEGLERALVDEPALAHEITRWMTSSSQQHRGNRRIEPIYRMLTAILERHLERNGGSRRQLELF